MLALNEEIQKLTSEAMQAARLEAEASRSEQAGALYRAVLELQPDHAGAHVGLGRLELQAGRPEAAIPHFASALQAAPGEEGHWLAYLDALMSARQFSTARELIELGRRYGLRDAVLVAFEQQLAACGAPSEHDIATATALYTAGSMEAAGNAARALVERFPQHPFGWKLLGAVLYSDRALGPAMEAMQKALSYGPDDAETLSNLGLLLKHTGLLEDAKAMLERSIALQPDSADARNRLAATLQEMGRPAEALDCAIAALALSPDHLEARNALALALDNLGRFAEAVEAYRHVLEQNPDHVNAHGNLLFCMSHMDSVTPVDLFREHRKFGERIEARLPMRRTWNNSRERDRALHVGFVSGDLRNHAVTSFIEPVLKRLAERPDLAIHAYYNYLLHDDVTTRLRSYITNWRNVATLDDVALDTQIRADGIDILIDLSGHTAYNRLPVFARKPAPLQASWIGYPGTTGLTAMDYYLADAFLLPPGQYDHLFTEKLIYLPVGAAFEPAVKAPPVTELPALTNGYLTFASFNRLSKINRKVIALWGSLLRALPDARLIMAGMPVEGSGHEQLAAWLQDEAIDRCRVSFQPRTGIQDYLAMYGQVDICLDAFPYTGGTTTAYALYMGVPTLTLASGTAAGRQTASLLAHHGLHQFIAYNAEDFLNKGLVASRDLIALANVRSTLRSGSPVWTESGIAGITDSLCDALRLMWQRHCAGLPPTSFKVPPASCANTASVHFPQPPRPPA